MKPQNTLPESHPSLSLRGTMEQWYIFFLPMVTWPHYEPAQASPVSQPGATHLFLSPPFPILSHHTFPSSPESHPACLFPGHLLIPVPPASSLSWDPQPSLAASGDLPLVLKLSRLKRPEQEQQVSMAILMCHILLATMSGPFVSGM